MEQGLAEVPARFEKLRKTRVNKLSRTDPDSRLLRDRRGFVLGYAPDLAVSEDHLTLDQRVTQAPTDNALLLPVLDRVKARCGERPQRASADSGFLSLHNLQELEARSVAGYVPDPNLARELNGRGCRRRTGQLHHPEHRRMRQKLRGPAGWAINTQRKAIIERC